MNFKESLNMFEINENEFHEMNIIKITKLYTRLKSDSKHDLAKLNSAYSILTETKKSNKVEDLIEDTKYSNIGIKENITPIVGENVNRYKISIPYKQGIKQLTVPLSALFDKVPENEYIITPENLKKGKIIYGVIDEYKIPYEIVLV